MMPRPGRLQSALARADALGDRASARLRKVLPSRRALLVIPYLGFATDSRIELSGRVLRDPGFRAPDQADPRWRNLVELYKRMQSDEVPFAPLWARFGGLTQSLAADDEGYFQVDIESATPLAPGWHRVEVGMQQPDGDAPPPQALGEVLRPPPDAGFGVISDIDDTVLWSNARDRRRMIWMLIRNNAHTRQPFHGVSAFYRALVAGPDGNAGNPLFYVSSSPWNLYTPLLDFMQRQGVPRGPLLLKDYGDHTLFQHRDHGRHKLASIRSILERYPLLPFVLIGDSGEQDPEIYTEIVRQYRDRIRVVYIRCVNPATTRLGAIDELAATVRDCGTQLVLATDSGLAATHAAGEGLIATAALAAIRADRSGVLGPSAA